MAQIPGTITVKMRDEQTVIMNEMAEMIAAVATAVGELAVEVGRPDVADKLEAAFNESAERLANGL